MANNYSLKIKRKFNSIRLDLLKKEIYDCGFKIIRDGYYPDDYKIYPNATYEFYINLVSRIIIGIGHNSNGNIFEICYRKPGDEDWTNLIPDFRKKEWKIISTLYNK